MVSRGPVSRALIACGVVIGQGIVASADGGGARLNPAGFFPVIAYGTYVSQHVTVPSNERLGRVCVFFMRRVWPCGLWCGLGRAGFVLAALRRKQPPYVLCVWVRLCVCARVWSLLAGRLRSLLLYVWDSGIAVTCSVLFHVCATNKHGFN